MSDKPHTCTFQCLRPECVIRQRDLLLEKLDQSIIDNIKQVRTINRLLRRKANLEADLAREIGIKEAITKERDVAFDAWDKAAKEIGIQASTYDISLNGMRQILKKFDPRNRE